MLKVSKYLSWYLHPGMSGFRVCAFDCFSDNKLMIQCIKYYHLLRTNLVPGTVASASHISTHLILNEWIRIIGFIAPVTSEVNAISDEAAEA